MTNQLFSIHEKKELKDMGITMSQLNKRYNQARQRAEARNEGILPIYDFYREFVTQLKVMAQKLNTIPKDLLPLIDIHSIKGYQVFKLMLRQHHQMLHAQKWREKAERVLMSGTLQCKHCGTTKSLNEMVRSTKTLCGYITTCKACDKRLRAERKALREVA